MLYRQNSIEIPSYQNAEILDTWKPILEGAGFIDESTSKERAQLISKIAHVQQLNENSSFDNSGFSTYGSIPGMGNPSFGGTLGGQTNFVNGAPGSGDKWLSPFAVSLQVSAKTVGFDIVSTIPIQGPTGMIYYIDYIYADGKLDGSGNDAPKMFKINIANFTGTEGQVFIASNQNTLAENAEMTGNGARLKFVGKAMHTGYPIFQLLGLGAISGNVVTDNTTITIANVFDGNAKVVPATTGSSTTGDTTDDTLIYSTTASAEYVVAMEDQVYGFANGEGGQDSVVYSGNFTSGDNLYQPALRGTAESERYLDMGVRTQSKNIETGTFKVAITVTQEQLQDMKKQHGFDLLAKCENALVNELSQNINKNILARAFALGWTNHIKANTSESVNLNISLDPSYTSGTDTVSYKKNDNTSGSMTIPAWTNYASSSASFENQDTVQRRIVSKINLASNLILQRGRFGHATGIVTNLQIASALQNIAGYTFNPFSNNLSTGSNLYPAGKIGNMQIFVDPNMKYTDTRVLVFRKGADDEPGLKFLPYLLGESVQTIQPNTASPKIFMTSRYALTEYGQRPEAQYLTFYVKTSAGGIA